MDTATFQAAITAVVMAAVTAVLANRSTINTNKIDKGVENSDRGNDPRNQQIVTVASTQNNNSKFKKWKCQNKVELKRFQRIATQQQPVATPTITTPVKREFAEQGKATIATRWGTLLVYVELPPPLELA